jgi:hypothetical protein
VVAPVAFVVSSLVIFWVAWPKLRIAMAITVIGVIVYIVVWLRSGRPAGQLAGGWWLVVYLAGITVLSALGSFDGADVLPAPWDSVVVAVFALAIYAWGVRSGVAHMLARPEMVRELRAEADHDRGDAPEEVTAAR